MITYTKWSPTPSDTKGLNLPDRQGWLVAPVGTNRDADALTRSNWRVVNKDLDKTDPDGEDHEVHRFGHWGPGWFEIILVRPDTRAAKCAEEWEAALDCYPVACDYDFSAEEQEEAHETWRVCYNAAQRLEYIRDNRNQFQFHDWQDLLGCVRGKRFNGCASELLS